MKCVTPHCAGTLRTGQTTGFCTLCHLPVSACSKCGGWNRSFAVFCRQCGEIETAWQTTDSVGPEALHPDPRVTLVPDRIATNPQPLAGFLWALGEGGDLYRLNPYAIPGEQLAIHDRFWAQPQAHAFCAVRLHHPFGHAAGASPLPPTEDCAVIATAERIVVSGLHSSQRRSLLPAEGEIFLVNAREEYQFVAAGCGSIYILSSYAEQTSFCHLSLDGTGDGRFAVAHRDTALCGPVLLRDGQAEHLVLWSAAALWVYTQGKLHQVPLPEGVSLRTAPADSPLGIPSGHSPAVPAKGQLYLACNQFGRPALLRIAPAGSGWAASPIAITDPGTLSQSTAGMPLLATSGRLLACTGPAFRTLVQDSQIATRFPAWSHEDLSIFFCEADYHGRKQWLKAYSGNAELPIAWNQPSGAEVHAVDRFWTLGTTLCTVCVVGERALRTEFISWCV